MSGPAEPTATEAFGPRFARTYTEVFLLASAIVLYWAGLHLTKPSPLTRTSAWQITVVGAYGLLLAAVCSLALAAVAVAIDTLVASSQRFERAGTIAAKTILTATLVLLFVDNILYSLVGASLRNEAGTPVKLAFLMLAIAPGLLWGRSAARPSARLVKSVTFGSIAVCVAAICVVAVYLRAEEAPMALEREGPGVAQNVVILSSDGLNADEMSVYSGQNATTPFLDSVADDFLIFENGFANNGNTTGSMTSLMTGRNPTETGVVYPPDALQQNDARQSLPYLLGTVGYRRTSWSVPHYVDSRAQNLVDAFDVDNGESPSIVGQLPLGTGPARWFVEDLTTWTAGLWADALWVKELVNPYDFVVSVDGSVAGDQQRVDGILRELRGEEPFFITSHFLVSHGPFFPLPGGRVEAQQEEIWDEEYYHEAIRVFDEYVEEVYSALEEAGKLERAGSCC